MVVRPKDKPPHFTYWTDSLARVSDLFPCDDSHKKNSIRLVERIPTVQISKVVRGKEMPTEIWRTSEPAPPSTAPATQTEQATFGLRLVKHAELGMTRSSWLNYALRDDEAVYWVSIGHYETVAVSNW